jgi:hypothetical protein
MSTNILYSADGRRIEFDMPDKALDLIEELADTGAGTEIAVTHATPLIIAAELRRIAAEVHEGAQNFDAAHLQVRKDDYLTFAVLLKQRATELDGES